MQAIIVATLQLMILAIPLVFTTVNSELFEFPKFLLLFTGTIVIATAWALDLYRQQKSLSSFVFRPSSLSLALLLVLATQALATVFSINFYTSFWGYYSRFHQGLLTTICYTLIYFSALKFLDYKSTQKLIKISVITATLISLYAVAQRFGIDHKLWIQDVVNRPFSTLGQPNWLAAYLLPNIFLTIYLAISKTVRANNHSPLHYLVYALLFTAILLTKSRSGFLAFALSYPAYWALTLRNLTWPKIKGPLLLFSLSSFIFCLIIGTPYTPPISQLLNNTSQPARLSAPADGGGTQLESGGTESGDIRKIVWTGALDLVKRRALLGTGPETFAYSYYWTRPTAHNYTSEWDFLYNKAHNEYLNIAATCGLIGLAAYLYWHFTIARLSLTKVAKSKKVKQAPQSALRAFYPVLAASLISFSVTNFFGFSVIPVYLTMILLSALPETFTLAERGRSSVNAFSQYYRLFGLLSFVLCLMFPFRLLLADLSYAKGKANLEGQNFLQAETLLARAISLRPWEPLFHSYLAETYAQLAVSQKSSPYRDLALQEIAFTSKSNPWHLNYLKSRTKTFLTLTLLDPAYHQQAAVELERGRELAPTDPKLAYNLGLVYSRLGDIPNSIKQMTDAIALKSNYYEPYYALTLLYEESKQTDLILPLLEQAQANFDPLPEPLEQKMLKYLP